VGERPAQTDGRVGSTGAEHADRAGANSFWFTGRVHGRKLRAGAYVLEARASYPGGGRSAAVKAPFRVRG